MEKGKMVKMSKENGRGGSAAESLSQGTLPGLLDRAVIVTTVRRMGYIAVKMHEVIMGGLVRDGKEALAEQFNDVFKPLADMLLHFELDPTVERKESKEDSDGL